MPRKSIKISPVENENLTQPGWQAIERAFAKGVWSVMLDVAPRVAGPENRKTKGEMTEQELIANFYEFDKKDSRGKAGHLYGSLEMAFQLLSKALSSPSRREAREAAEMLASLGFWKCIPLLKRAVRKHPGALVPVVVRGFRKALQEFPDASVLRSDMVTVFTQVFERDCNVDYPELVAFALETDVNKALEVILSPKCWRSDNPLVATFITVIAVKSVKIPVEHVRKVLKAMPAGKITDYRTYAALLECYALAAPAEAEPLIRKVLAGKARAKSNLNRADFAKALCTAKGIVAPEQKIGTRLEILGETSLVPVERTFQVVLHFYYSCMCGDYSAFLEDYITGIWNVLHDALAEIGAPKYVALLDKWAAIVPGVKPGKKGFAFSDAYERLEKKTGKHLDSEFGTLLEKLETEGDEIVTLAYLWLAENADKVLEAWSGGDSGALIAGR